MANIVACLIMLTIVVQTHCTDDISNTVSTVRANVTMRCKTRSGNCSDVIWAFGTNAISIYKGEYGFLGDYGSRYSIDATSGCHLIVKNVQLTDAGRFRCIDETSTTDISKSAELIILESEPKCNASADANTTAEGEEVLLSCEVIFNGTNRVSMTWKDMENVPSSTKTGTTVRLSHNVTAERPFVPSFECIASFEVVREGTNLVPNIPTVSCKTQSIRILYGVKSAELAPSQSVYYPGSSVNCSSDGNPPPTFKWQKSGMENGSWKDVADVTGPQFSTSNETFYYYRCVASHVVKNINYNTTSSIFTVNYPAAAATASSTFRVKSPIAATTESQMTGGPDKTIVRAADASYAEDNKGSFGVGIASGFGIGFVVALLFVFVVLFILFRLKLLQIRRSSGNTPKGSSKAIDAKSTKEHEVQDYYNLELKNDGNTAVPSQAALPAEATYASLQKQEEDLHCYSSLAEEETKRRKI